MTVLMSTTLLSTLLPSISPSIFTLPTLNLFSAGPMESDTRTKAIHTNTSDATGNIVPVPKNPAQMSESAAPKPQRTPLPTSRPPRPPSQPPLPQQGCWQAANGPEPTTFNTETTKRVNKLLQKFVNDTRTCPLSGTNQKMSSSSFYERTMSRITGFRA
jgi:hypothetical protein